MPRPKNPVPTYQLHKQSGQAIVTISVNGIRRDLLLGKHGSPESKQEYERVLHSLRSPGGAGSAPSPTPPGGVPSSPRSRELPGRAILRIRPGSIAPVSSPGTGWTNAPIGTGRANQPRTFVVYDILCEDPQPLHQAARSSPVFRHLSGKTLTRYALKGVLRDGRRVKLEAVRVGGRLFTSSAALGRFVEACNDAPEEVAAARTPSARLRASERAAAELDRRMNA